MAEPMRLRGIRMPDEMWARMQRLAGCLRGTKYTEFVQCSVSAVARAALDRGITAIEKELEATDG